MRVNPRSLLEVLSRVAVLHIVPRHVEFKLGPKVLEVLVERQVGAHLDARREPRLERPRPRDVPDRVAAAADNDERDVERSHERDARRVPCYSYARSISLGVNERAERISW